MLSVNQTHAQIKLLEMWKAVNISNHPIKVNRVIRANEVAVTRSSETNNLVEFGNSVISQKTYINNAKYIWNQAPASIKNSASIYSAKISIKEYVKTLPI